MSKKKKVETTQQNIEPINTTVSKNEPTNTTTIQYQGQVKFKYKIKNKIFEYNIHNEGTKLLFQSFAKFITGYFSYNDIPQFIDLRISTQSNESMLKVKPRVSRSYSEIQNEWIAQFSCNIDSQNLIAPTGTVGDYYYLCLTNKVDDTYNAFAYMKIPAANIDYLLANAGVTALVEWTMKLENKNLEEGE